MSNITFKNLFRVFNYLKKTGYTIGKSRLYYSRDKGLIKVNSDRSVSVADAIEYAKTYLEEEKISRASEIFHGFHFRKMEHAARSWAGRYPCIEKIAIYHSSQLCDEENSIRYVLVVTSPDFPKKELPTNEDKWTDEDVFNYKLIQYFNWKDTACSHILRDINTFYKDPDRSDITEWMWFCVTPEEAEDLDGFNGGGEDPFMSLESEVVLYNRPPM